MASNEETGYVFIENWMDVTATGMGRFQLHQVNVQKWEGGQITEERFYHK